MDRQGRDRFRRQALAILAWTASSWFAGRVGQQKQSGVDASLGDVVAARIFIQNPSDTVAVMAEFGECFRGVDPAMTLTCPPLSSEAYKVEIEVTAYRGASKGNVELKTI